jgi:hypothetical protein
MARKQTTGTAICSISRDMLAFILFYCCCLNAALMPLLLLLLLLVPKSFCGLWTSYSSASSSSSSSSQPLATISLWSLSCHGLISCGTCTLCRGWFEIASVVLCVEGVLVVGGEAGDGAGVLVSYGLRLCL